MKQTSLHRILLICSFLCFGLMNLNLKAQNDTLYIDTNFNKVNFRKASKVFLSNTIDSSINKIFRDDLFSEIDSLDSKLTNNFHEVTIFSFTIKNNDSTKRKLVFEISNVLLDEIFFYEKSNAGFELINKTGIAFPFQDRIIEDRKFLFPFELEPNENKTLVLEFRKNSLSYILPGTVWDKNALQKYNKGQYLVIGIYFGLSFISVFIGLFIYFFLRKSIYLIYGLYVILLGVYLLLYLGLFFQFFTLESMPFNNNIYIFFLVSSVVLFITFSQKILKASENVPRLKRVIDIVLILLIILRFSEFFIAPEVFSKFKPTIILIWYLSFIFLNVALVLEMVASYKKDKKITVLFAIAFSFMSVGTVITILHHSLGLINSYVYGLPIVFYTSTFEILFLTFAIITMVKEIYDERNILSKKLVYQQQRFLTAFINGQEKERERIGKELHDNVGSRLGNFKRLFAKSYSNKKLNEEIDLICNDVRDLSHQITPSQIKLVGLPGAISDLISSYTNDNLVINYNCYQFPEEINESIATNLYRIVQETLNNISKHASASHIDIQLIGHEDSLTLTIEDNGKGFDRNRIKSGLGLKNIKSRVDKLRGNFLLDSSINRGTSVLITIPIV